MKFVAKDEVKSAWLTDSDSDTVFGMIGDERSPSTPYVCYYPKASNHDMPYALTPRGLQIPTKGYKGKFFSYEDLDRIVKIGDEIAEIHGKKPAE